MRILIAPDGFKGSLPARPVAEAIAAGILDARTDARVDVCPMADGGDGTLEVMMAAQRGQRRRAACHDPLGRFIEAELGLFDRAATALIEFAAAAGLTLLSREERDPLRATTFGVGELIAAAIDGGVDRITLALGGSAAVDGGCGLAQALGMQLTDQSGHSLPTPLPPQRLTEIRTIQVEPLVERLGDVQITLAVDVLNRLLGPDGAAAVFGPQKGADARGVRILEKAMNHWVGLLESSCGRPLRDEPGTGAAGGAGLPLLAFGGAAVVPGVDLVADAARLRDRLGGVQLVITGEGRLDRQSRMGKVVGCVARMARVAGVPCAAVVGSLGPGWEEAARELLRVIALAEDEGDVASAMREVRQRLRAAGATLAREFTPG